MEREPRDERLLLVAPLVVALQAGEQENRGGVPVERVVQHGRARGGEVHADLVGASCERSALEPREAPERLQNAELGGARLAAALPEDAHASRDLLVLADGKVDYSDPNVRDGGGQVTLRIFKCLKPVIAAVNGPAVGIGVTMQLAMDIRIASDAARFGFVFSQRGIVPEAASSWFLPRLVGISQALEWCYTGRVFPAQEALAGRLVSKVVPADELLPTARALAREIAAKTAPVSVALIRQMMWRMLGADDPMEAHKVDSRGIYARGRSDDVKEGVVSFLEKRPAQFKNTVSADMPDYFPWWQERDYK